MNVARIIVDMKVACKFVIARVEIAIFRDIAPPVDPLQPVWIANRVFATSAWHLARTATILFVACVGPALVSFATVLSAERRHADHSLIFASNAMMPTVKIVWIAIRMTASFWVKKTLTNLSSIVALVVGATAVSTETCQCEARPNP